jgi:APA family basic amino acid/polyamine antiporter
MVTSMLVNFILICLSVVFLPLKNKFLSAKMLGYRFPKIRTLMAILGVFLLFILLVFHTIKDLNSALSHWYFKATWVWLIVMTMGSVWFFTFWLKNKNGKSHFEELPEG